MWNESESDKRARIHREHMETTQRLQEEANVLASRQADLLEEQAFHAAQGAFHAYEMREAVDKLHETAELRLKEERQYRLEEQRAAIRRAGLSEFSELFQQEWLRLNRLLEQYRSEKARLDAEHEKFEGAVKKLDQDLQTAGQELRARIEQSLRTGEPFGPRVFSKISTSLHGVPGMVSVLAARTGLQNRDLLSKARENPNSIYELACEISTTQQLAGSLKVNTEYRRKSWPYVLSVVGGFFGLSGFMMLLMIIEGLFGKFNSAPLSAASIVNGIAAVFWGLILGAIGFSPLFYFRRQNERTWDELLSLYSWAVCCERVALELGLNIASRLPETIQRKDWHGWPNYCSGLPVETSLGRILTAIVCQFSSRMVEATDDATAKRILTLRIEIDRLITSQRTNRQTWIAGQKERTAEIKRWGFLRDQLEQVGQEIVAGHRLSGGKITLLECPNCGGLITSESTNCSHCVRLIPSTGRPPIGDA